MKKLLVLLLLSGCSSLAPYVAPSVVPALTLELCGEVTYHRKGTEATINAKCHVPAR